MSRVLGLREEKRRGVLVRGGDRGREGERMSTLAPTNQSVESSPIPSSFERKRKKGSWASRSKRYFLE